MSTEEAPPIIDISAFYRNDDTAKQSLIDQVRSACKTFGFLQIVNHNVPDSLQQDILRQSEDFFNLPLETKEKYNKDIGGLHLEYERLRAQNFEKKTDGDLKEGYYFGTDLPLDHSYVVAGKLNFGPNKYPEEVSNPESFRMTMKAYFASMESLAYDILRILAATLYLEENFFNDFIDTPIATLRLLHYPPQPPTASPDERVFIHVRLCKARVLREEKKQDLKCHKCQREFSSDKVRARHQTNCQGGDFSAETMKNNTCDKCHRIFKCKALREEHGIGAHTNFGDITILLQDMIGGLQVWNGDNDRWVDVEPRKGAFVVNLGNLMMRWTNDNYMSNLHRDINKTGKERYSVPFFFSGNPDYVVKCLPSCEGTNGAKYPPVSVEEWIAGRYADTYGSQDSKS